MQKETDRDIEKLQYLQDHIELISYYLDVRQDIQIILAVSHWLCPQCEEEELLAYEQLKQLFEVGKLEMKGQEKVGISLRSVLEKMILVISQLFKYHQNEELVPGNLNQVIHQKQKELSLLKGEFS